MRRHVEEVEFGQGGTGPVVEQMARLARAEDGWINLLPGVVDDESEGPKRPSALSGLFGSATAPVTMGTWIPARRGRHADEVTVGIAHPRGRHAVAQLRDMGIALPDGWRVGQDHNRRGLIVFAPVARSHADVLDWVLRAGAALATVPLSGSWQARIFEPVPR